MDKELYKSFRRISVSANRALKLIEERLAQQDILEIEKLFLIRAQKKLFDLRETLRGGTVIFGSDGEKK